MKAAVPMSFGIKYLAPLIPAFLARYPEVDLDLSLSDEVVDLVGGGFDLALRIAALADSSLRARRLCRVRRPLVGSPAYFAKHGRPKHPRELEHHVCLIYTNLATPQLWTFRHTSGSECAVSVRGRLKINNADALEPALLAGQGLALQPEFLVWDDIAAGRLIEVLPEWQIEEIAINLVTPPGKLRPARVTVLLDYLSESLARAPWARQPTERAPQRAMHANRVV